MKKYKKTYYLDNGSNLEITIKDRTLDDIYKDIVSTIEKDYVTEWFEDKLIAINMKKVSYIYVEEVEYCNNNIELTSRLIDATDILKGNDE